MFRRMITGNYHTHTYRCKHAFNDVADYAAEAVTHGLAELGMTDHCPLPNDQWNHVHMDAADLEGYLQAIEDARIAFPSLRFYRGLECEYLPYDRDFYLNELLRHHKLDYLIFGAHWFYSQGKWFCAYGECNTMERLKGYCDYVVQAMRSGVFLFVAHPDLFGGDIMEWTLEVETCAMTIIDAAVELNMPLEINGLGLRKPHIDTPAGRRPMYPWNRFWECCEGAGVQVIVNSDAHTPKDITANHDEAKAIANRYHLPLCDFPTVFKAYRVRIDALLAKQKN
ncbi:MAG: histidinol phosphatase [Spartobacteria bacterium]|nr:histidinol phosphatase [Spartobacteria bacterium]